MEEKILGACFPKVPKLFGSISGTTISLISSQRRGSKPSNFAILLVFLTLKACLKINYSKQADCSFTTGFSGPKSSRDFRETGPWSEHMHALQEWSLRLWSLWVVARFSTQFWPFGPLLVLWYHCYCWLAFSGILLDINLISFDQ